eukprot:TRINITY_DN6931_c0_g3_i1.p2 TRINITY_DN6931_c0_g3~~TRINITY_DN6931_c0_g3_i1.p2  ORF type:complete len:151 (+),score=53.63 TRINITY_DN6931_c0_g3_i1:68-454(+)
MVARAQAARMAWSKEEKGSEKGGADDGKSADGKLDGRLPVGEGVGQGGSNEKQWLEMQQRDELERLKQDAMLLQNKMKGLAPVDGKDGGKGSVERRRTSSDTSTSQISSDGDGMERKEEEQTDNRLEE